MKLKIKKNKISEDGANVLIQNARLAFVHLAKPSNSPGANSDPNYEVTILIPKKQKKEFDQLKTILDETIKQSKAFEKAEQRKKAASVALKIHQDGSIIKDGDKMLNRDGVVYDGLEDHYCIKVKTKADLKSDNTYAPKVKFPLKYRSNEDVPTEALASEFYSGIWADVSINFKGYVFAKKKFGVTAYLGGVMKLKNGERLGGSNPFEARDDIVEDEYDEEEGY